MSIWNYNEVPVIFYRLLLLALASVVYAFNLKPMTWFIKISFLIGQILVNSLLAAFYFLTEASKSTFVVLQIIYEDALIFLEDTREIVVFVSHLIKDFNYFFYKRVVGACAYGGSFVETVLGYAISVTKAVIYVCNLISTAAERIQYLGTYIWNVFISIPKTLIYYLNSVKDFIEDSKNEMFNRILLYLDGFFQILQRFYLSFFDIKIESVCGLIIGTIFLIVFCTKFKKLCAIIFNVILKICKNTLSILSNVYSKNLTGRSNNQRFNLVHSKEPELDDERLCVICQVNYKEVIIFPCKHLCLCVLCDATLLQNQDTCPICRTKIRETFKVYF